VESARRRIPVGRLEVDFLLQTFCYDTCETHSNGVAVFQNLPCCRKYVPFQTLHSIAVGSLSLTFLAEPDRGHLDNAAFMIFMVISTDFDTVDNLS